ncbi:MAG: hypothetical protein HGA76_12200 [Candidatus Firestonebacteria bacterium]|nr:hypothetical protein [Candidatus Firestonebacteria bacterium]
MLGLMEKTLNAESLYLVFADGSQLFLSREHIDKATERYWRDSSKIPDHVRAAIDFQRCVRCPMSNDQTICDALRPILPLLDYVDKFNSTDRVQVVYGGAEPEVFQIANTNMQTALSYVSVLSLINYCQAGRKYRKYYYGISPLSSSSTVASRLYMNIFWLHRGDRQAIDQVVSDFGHMMMILSQNQVKRLNLICQNDAFNNSFVNAHVATALLSLGMDRYLQEMFDEFEKIS